MTGDKKEVSKESIVNSAVDNILDEIGTKKISWTAVWNDAWEDIVDQAEMYGFFLKDDSAPKFPDYILKTKDVKAEVKKQLLQIFEIRMK
jgi:hypothetical protein